MRGTLLQESTLRSPARMPLTGLTIIIPSGDTSGVTDTARIQAALNAGKFVLLAPGDFWSTGIYLASYSKLQGSGMGVTVLHLAAGLTAPAWVLRASQGATVASIYWTVSDLSIDGNKDAYGSTNTGRYFGFYVGSNPYLVANGTIINVEARNCKTYAFDTEWSKSIRYINCWSHDNGYTTGTSNNCSGWEILGDDVTLVSCHGYNNAAHGVTSGETAAVRYRTKLIACTMESNSGSGAFFHNGMTLGQIIGGSYRDNAVHGIIFSSSANKCTVTGGTTVSGNQQSGVRLDGVDHCTVAQNILDNNALAGSGNPSIYLTNSATYNTVAQNIIGAGAATNSIQEQNSSSNFNTIRANTVDKPIVTAGPNTTTQDSASAQPTGAFTPADHNLITWAFDPGTSITSGPASGTSPNIAGTVNLIELIIPSAATVTNIIMMLSTAGATLTAGQCFAALYDSSGNLLGQTADQATNWTTTGTKTMALTTPVAVSAGKVYVAVWANGTTLPLFGRGDNNSVVNAGLSSATARFATANTGVTTTAPNPLGAKTISSTAYWAALS